MISKMKVVGLVALTAGLTQAYHLNQSQIQKQKELVEAMGNPIKGNSYSFNGSVRNIERFSKKNRIIVNYTISSAESEALIHVARYNKDKWTDIKVGDTVKGEGIVSSMRNPIDPIDQVDFGIYVNNPNASHLRLNRADTKRLISLEHVTMTEVSLETNKSETSYKSK